jgi:hypothetical protein
LVSYVPELAYNRRLRPMIGLAWRENGAGSSGG